MMEEQCFPTTKRVRIHSLFKKLSVAQQQPVLSILKGNHAGVLACAGSGKSTLMLIGAVLYHLWTGKDVIIIMYNRMAREQTIKRLREMFDESIWVHIHIHTNHSCAATYFIESYTTSSEQSVCGDACRKGVPKPRAYAILSRVGLLCLDEAQDLTPGYCSLARLLLRMIGQDLPIVDENKNTPLPGRGQLMIVGDIFQAIYTFNGSSDTYLRNPEYWFGSYCKPGGVFTTHRLNICYRITHEMAAWINVNLHPKFLKFAETENPQWWEQNKDYLLDVFGLGIQADPKRPACPGSVSEFHCPGLFRGKLNAGLKRELKYIQEKFGAKNTAILSLSVHSPPCKSLFQEMSRLKTEDNNWVVLDNETSGTPNVTANKGIVSSVHKCKGMEFPAVIFSGFDDYQERTTKFKIFENPSKLYNLFYVALTRASQKLVICSSAKNPYVTQRRDYLPAKYLTCSAFTRFSSYPSLKRKHSTSQLRDVSLQHCLQHVPHSYSLDRQVKTTLFSSSSTSSETPTTLMPIHLKEGARIVPGRTADTKEPLTKIYRKTIWLAIELWCKGRLQTMHGGGTRAQTQEMVSIRKSFSVLSKNFTRASFLSLSTTPLLSPENWQLLFRAANAADAIERDYTPLWFQFKGYKSIDLEYLNGCARNMFALLMRVGGKKSVEEHHWCVSHYPSMVIPGSWGQPWKVFRAEVDLTLPAQNIHVFAAIDQSASTTLMHRAIGARAIVQYRPTLLHQTPVQSKATITTYFAPQKKKEEDGKKGEEEEEEEKGKKPPLQSFILCPDEAQVYVVSRESGEEDKTKEKDTSLGDVHYVQQLLTRRASTLLEQRPMSPPPLTASLFKHTKPLCVTPIASSVKLNFKTMFS